MQKNSGMLFVIIGTILAGVGSLIGFILMLVSMFGTVGNAMMSGGFSAEQGSAEMMSGLGLTTIFMYIGPIIGYILLLVGLFITKKALNEEGSSGLTFIIIAIILMILGSLLGLIPIAGFIIAMILYVVAYILMFVGLGKVKRSLPSPKGIGLITAFLILGIIASVTGIIPAVGAVKSVINSAPAESTATEAPAE